MERLESVREVAEELVACMWVAAQREKSGLESPVLMAPGEVGCSRRRLDVMNAPLQAG